MILYIITLLLQTQHPSSRINFIMYHFKRIPADLGWVLGTNGRNESLQEEGTSGQSLGKLDVSLVQQNVPKVIWIYIYVFLMLTYWNEIWTYHLKICIKIVHWQNRIYRKTMHRNTEI